MTTGHTPAAGYGARTARGANGASSNGHGQGFPLPKPDLPEFPVHALPKVLADYARAVAEETQTPVDLACGAILTVCSAASLKVRVRVRGNWTQELALYVIVALPSGERKSTVLHAADAPLREIERRRRLEAAPRIQENKTERDVLTAKREKAKRTKDVNYAALHVLDDQLAALPDLFPPQLLADDVTPEVLATLIAEQGSIAILSGESAVLDNITGRYSDGRANLHLVLNAYEGDPVRVDRRGRKEQLDRPLIALGLVTQPHVLAEIVGNKQMREQGLLSRPAFLVPTSALGIRRVDADPVPEPIGESYHGVVRRLAEVPRDTMLDLSDTAAMEFRKLRLSIEPRLNPDGGDLVPISHWVERHAGRVARIAGLLHLVEGDHRSAIGAQVMLNAIEIGECLLAHARWVLNQPERDEITRVLDWGRDQPAGRFTRRDAHALLTSRHAPVARTRALLNRMVELGYLAALEMLPPNPQGGRPPSPIYLVVGWKAPEEDPDDGPDESSNGDQPSSGAAEGA